MGPGPSVGVVVVGVVVGGVVVGGVVVGGVVVGGVIVGVPISIWHAGSEQSSIGNPAYASGTG